MDLLIDILEFVYETFAGKVASAFGCVTERQRKTVQNVFAVITLIFYCMLFAGIVILFSQGARSALGWAFFGAGALYIAAGITFNAISRRKRKTDEKTGQSEGK
ncbi:MAG: hypothetical protein J5530_01335 [Clostridia bacterium]|nr:hypothetical protein [Clostridia bacterium]